MINNTGFLSQKRILLAILIQNNISEIWFEKAAFVIPVEARRATIPRKLRSSSRAAGVGRGDLLDPREVNGGDDEEKSRRKLRRC